MEVWDKLIDSNDFETLYQSINTYIHEKAIKEDELEYSKI